MTSADAAIVLAGIVADDDAKLTDEQMQALTMGIGALGREAFVVSPRWFETPAEPTLCPEVYAGMRCHLPTGHVGTHVSYRALAVAGENRRVQCSWPSA